MTAVFTDKREKIGILKKLKYGTTFLYEGVIYTLSREVDDLEDCYWALDIKSAILSPDPVKNYQSFSGECPVELVELEISFK